MKKTFVLLVALLATSGLVKAVELGDFITNDPTGVPAIVVYLDESGEHGLMMSPRAFWESEYKDFVKREKTAHSYNVKQQEKMFAKREAKGEDVSTDRAIVQARNERYDVVMKWLASAPRLFEGKAKKKAQVYGGVEAKTVGHGDENQKIITDYCQENNVDLALFFPAENWAIQLGEGWFVPGNDELELMALNNVKGLGRQYNLTLSELVQLGKETAPYAEELRKTGKTSHKGLMMQRNIESGFWLLNLHSSTMNNSSWEKEGNNEDKTAIYVGGNSDPFYVLTTITNQVGSINYWAFCTGVQDVVVAFKRF